MGPKKEMKADADQEGGGISSGKYRGRCSGKQLFETTTGGRGGGYPGQKKAAQQILPAAKGGTGRSGGRDSAYVVSEVLV